MSEGVPQPSQSSGGGSSNQGKWGSTGVTSWWPLGVAGVTALLTAQAAAGVESENTYVQVSDCSHATSVFAQVVAVS
jgi:hypothetical protein